MPADARGSRLSILGIVVLSLFVALLGRVWYLQVMAAPSAQEVTAANQVRTVQLPPMRGRIVDRVGRILADNRRTLVVTVERKAIRKKVDREPLFMRLAGVLGTTPEELEERRQDGGFDPLLPLPVAEAVDESVAVYLRERQEDYPGVEVTEGWQRVYSYAPIGSHIVGYVGRIPDDEDEAKAYTEQGYQLSDLVGRSGIEMSFEEDLRGTPGFVRYEVDANNRVVHEIERVDPIAGRDVQLAIDLKVQQYAEQVLEAGLKEARTRSPKKKPGVFFKAPAGALVVEDPRTGEILAMASNPPFDNRFFVGGISQAKYNELFGETSGNPLVNRAIQGGYQIGSTMKMFTSVAALNSGILGCSNCRMEDTGKYVIPNCKDEPSGCEKQNAGGALYGRINLPEALLVSSDVYFYGLGNDMWTRSQEGQNILQDEVGRFGMGSKSGIDLPFERSGIVPTKEVKADLAARGVISDREGSDYYTGDNIQLAIGQGLLAVTPLQLVNGYATFANGGTHFRPLIALKVLTPGTPDGASPGMVDLTQSSDVEVFAPQALNQVALPPSVYTPIMNGLIGVLRGYANGHKGTAVEPFRTYNYDAYPLAGKTGTAQDFSKLDEKDTSLFVGLGPIKAGTPVQYTVGAVLEQAGYGSWSAAPTVRCMFEALSGQRPMAEPVQAEQLDKQTATRAGVLPPLTDTSCLVSPPQEVND